MNFILRRLQGQGSQLTSEYVQSVLEMQKDDDRIFRAIINSSLSNKKQQEEIKEFEIHPTTEFAKALLLQLQLSLVCKNPYFFKQSIKITLPNYTVDINQYNEQVSELELLKQQLQFIYRLYKATIRNNGDGLHEVNNHLTKLLQFQIQIDEQFAQKCLDSAPQYIEGLDQLTIWHKSSEKLYAQVREARISIQGAKQQSLFRQIKIVEKYKSIQRIKFTLEKLKILKQTFGSLAQAMSIYDDNAYEIIPIMKETQNSINKYKLNELKLACISENFFENKVECLKERIKEGIFANFLKFDENKYSSLLKSYFYLEKHYQMQSFVTQIWTIAKKSISTTFKSAIKAFESSYQPQKIYQNVQDEDLVQFYRVLYGEIVEQMLNFHYCNRFHQEYVIDQETKEFQDYADIIRQSVLEMRQLIWSQIQKKISKILKHHSINILGIQVQDLVSFLGFNCLLIKRAEDFSHSDSQILTQSIVDIYMSYVTQLHKKNLKSISTYLSNELYQRLPLAKDSKFTQQIAQISLLKQVNVKLFEYLIQIREENYSPEAKKAMEMSELMSDDNELQLFYLFEYQNPFRLASEEFELVTKAFWIKKQVQQTINSSTEIVLTSSSIRILELLPLYVQLAFYHPVCQQYVISLFLQMLELFMFISYTSLVGPNQQRQLLENFQQIIKFDETRDVEFFIQNYDQFSECLVLQERFCLFKRFIQKFCTSGIDLKELDLFGGKEKKQFIDIIERAVASEALLYLWSQGKNGFQSVNIESQTFEVFKDIYNQYKEFIYRNFVQTFIKIDGIVQYIPQQKWEIKELHNENNSIYLDRLKQFILDQRERLKSIGGGVIPTNAQKDIFQFLAEHCLNVLLETYGKIKKLNNIGREQMTQEFTICQQAIENSKKTNDSILNQKILQTQLEYLKIFNSQNYEDIDLFISKYKTNIPLRLLYNLMISNQSYNKLSKQVKKDLLVKFFKDYYDTFKLF